MTVRKLSLFAALFVCLAMRCTVDADVGFDGAAAGGNQSAGGGMSGGSRPFPSGAGGAAGAEPVSGGSASCEPSECLGKIYQCGDCDDNDDDGLTDALDPDCLGPCDNTEDSYYGGLPGQGGDACRLDCYFDHDSGSGNDGCDWNRSCDSDVTCSRGPTATPTECTAWTQAQPSTCLDTCLPLTPNGCDCFGCCELPARSGHFVFVGLTTDNTTCDENHLDDPNVCPSCRPVPSCYNACEACETCVGERGPDPNCANNAPACPFGREPCASEAKCAAGAYCITGCCVDVPR